MRMLKKDQDNVLSSESSTLISSKQMSHYASMIILLLFFAFIAGYYWGKKATIADLKETFDRETVADKISYSLALNSQTIDHNDGESGGEIC